MHSLVDLSNKGVDIILKSVYLISCTKSKQSYTCMVEEMYKPSTQFRAALTYALNRVDNKLEQIFILSAKYGLLSLTDIIDTYNETLIGKPSSYCMQWGKRVFDSINERFDVENIHFVFLAGKAYVQPLARYMRYYETPLNGKRMGEAVSWMQKNAYSNISAITSTPINILSSATTKKKENLEVPLKDTGVIVFARDLRSKMELQQVPNDKPGWYRWWATKHALEQLLDSRYVSKNYLNEIQPYLRKGEADLEGYFCIYVGVAIKESIRARLDWHVNQLHTNNAVQYGTLSTLRQSIASLVAGNQYVETTTNQLIDMLVIEYHTIDYPIKSQEAKTLIEQIEHNEIDSTVLPLNIKDNHNPIIGPFKSDLKAARKLSKQG